MACFEMETPKMKRCSKCGEHKKASDFYDSQSRNGSWCRACFRVDYVNRKDAIRWQRIFRGYGLSRADYEIMLKTQSGVCDICKKPEHNARFKFLAVDHDHATGKVRGLLCHRCNAGLGNFNDDARLLSEAIRFIERHSDGDALIETSTTEISAPAGILGVF
jgi:hypothetical protein